MESDPLFFEVILADSLGLIIILLFVCILALVAFVPDHESDPNWDKESALKWSPTVKGSKEH
jgi:hypothetical protein